MFNIFRRRGRRHDTPGSWLKPEAKQAVLGVLLLIFAIVIGLSFFGQAGRAGSGLLLSLRSVFGWLAYGTPILLSYIGWRLLRPNSEPLERWRIVGAILLLVGVAGVLHLIGVSQDDALEVAFDRKGGGFLGFMLSFPLRLALSTLVAGLIFAAAILIGIFMTFNVSLTEVSQWLQGFLPRRVASGKASDEGDDEEAEAPAAVLPRFRISPMRAHRQPDPQQLPLDQHAQRERQQYDMRRRQVKAANRAYNPPPLELLASSTRAPEGGDVNANKEIVRATLENFGITVEMRKARVGPTVTQYTLRPDEGVRLSQITALQNDLARALKAHPVRIEAPIPNTDLVGIEIPNKEVALVRLRELLSSREFRQSESPLSFCLGKDVSGGVVVAELDRMPHMLIAGATNSGKSVSIHSILMSLLYRNSPALLRLVLVDPKRVELTAYNGIPHLWGESVIVDTSKTLNALKWALREMDSRYKLLEESGTRNIMSYNINNTKSPLPFIVIVVDELADLMAKHTREVEGPIVRLSQLARAVGIHLILATQRPSVNVITGLIKANIPSRVGFKVASQVDSRTILDMAGSEKLVGTGDMLYLASDTTKPRRLQGGYVSEEEVREVVKYIIEHNEVEDYQADQSITTTNVKDATGGDAFDDDSLFEDAKRVAVEFGKVSASLLQRRLRVGYARAARLLDILEREGVISKPDGNKPREVLVGDEEDQYGAEVESNEVADRVPDEDDTVVSDFDEEPKAPERW